MGKSVQETRKFSVKPAGRYPENGEVLASLPLYFEKSFTQCAGAVLGGGGRVLVGSSVGMVRLGNCR